MTDIVRVPWQDQYFFSAQATSISTAGTFAAAQLGIDDGDYGLLTTNHPDLSPGLTISDQRKSWGVSYRRGDTGFEYVPTIQSPTVTLEMDATAWNIAMFGWLLCQKGVTETDATTIFTYVINEPSTAEGADCEVWGAVCRKLTGTDAALSQAIHGCICRSMTLSGAQGELVKLSVELAGRIYTNVFNAYSLSFTHEEKAPLLHQNAETTLGGTAIDLESWSITFTNNAVSKHYDNQHPVKHLIQDCTASGNIRFPWGTDTIGQATPITSFLAGTVTQLNIGWPISAVAVDDVLLDVYCRYSGDPTLATEDEIVYDLPFEASYTSGSGHSFEITAVTDYDLGVPA